MALDTVEGFTGDKFAAAKDAFAHNLASGADLGASFCATLDGETVIDLWGGWADEAKTRPWERDTIVNVYSTTKTMSFLCALMLADQGQLDFTAPVAKYWPQFAAEGKGEIPVSYLMAHTAGLSGWRQPMVTEDLFDWEKCVSGLAAQAPLWEPGTRSGYHAITQGYLIGEVVRRVTGRTIGTFFRDEIAGPLGADFWIGLPASEDRRVADLIPPPPAGDISNLAQDELSKLTLSNPVVDVLATRTRAWRGAEIPAAGGTGNARAVAGVHRILANGGVANGKRFMSEAGCRKALEVQIDNTDLILGGPIKFGMGFGIAGGMVPAPNPDTIFWGGYGGSVIIIDMTAHATYAYAMNKMGGGTVGDNRSFAMIGAMWQAMAA